MTDNILIVGDCHCSTSTIEDVKHAFKSVTRIIKKNKVAVLCFAGDIFDLHGTIKSEAYNFFIRSLKKWLKTFPELKIILDVGNHDFINNSIYCTDQHFLNPFKEWERITVVDKPQEYFIGKNRIAIFPYIPEGRYFEAHNEFLNGSFDFKLFISHQTFKGGRMDNGIPSETSDVWAPNYPLQISGHLHTPHQVSSNLEYIGSLIHCKHSEEGKKRLMLIEFTEEDYEVYEFELEPLEIYETITFNIKEDDLKTLKMGKKIRYILTGGSMGELVSFALQNKKIFGSKVKYQPLEHANTIDFSADDSDPIAELKNLIKDPILEELEPEEAVIGKFKLSPPKRELTLEIDNYIQVKDKIFEIEPGLTAIRGNNGIGKTTLLNAIEWLLYGGNSPDGKSTSVSLYNSDKWKIKRISKPRQLTLEIENNDTYFDGVAQTIIDNTFGSKVLWNTINYLEQKKTCNFFSYTDKEKKEFFSQIFSKSSALRKIYYKIEEREREAKNQVEKLEIEFQNVIELIGEEIEEYPELKVSDLEDLPKPNLSYLQELPEPEIERFQEPSPLYTEDLKIPECPDVSRFNEVLTFKPKDPPEITPWQEPNPLYLDDLKDSEAPDVSHLISLDIPFYEETPKPDLSIWKEIKVPDDYSIDKEISKNEKLEKELKKALKNNEEYAENEMRKSRRKILLEKKKSTTEAEKMLSIKRQLEDMSEIEPNNYSDEEMKLLQRKNDNIVHINNYKNKYQREPEEERIYEIDLEMKYSDAHETQCPSCNSALLALLPRNKSIELVISRGQKPKQKPNDEERQLLLKVDYSLSYPEKSMTLARKEQLKYDLMKEYIPGDYQIFIEEQNAISAELTFLTIKNIELIDVESITNKIKNIKAKIEEMQSWEIIRKENERKRTEKNKVLSHWKEENRKRKEEFESSVINENKRREELRNKILYKWKEECHQIQNERNKRIKNWQEERDKSFRKWENMKKAILKEWKDENILLESRINEENKRRNNEKEKILNDWREEKRRIEREIEMRKEKWQTERKRLLFQWEERKKSIIFEWNKENARRKEETRRLITDWQDTNTFRRNEKIRREKEYTEKCKIIRKHNSKRTKIKESREEQRETLAKLKDYLSICRQLETKYFNQQLEVFNTIFDNVISQIFQGATGKISSTRENKNGSLSERITLEFWIDGIKRTDLKTLSCGQCDLVSLAFQIALISITPAPFKIILLDEPFSQLHKNRLDNLVCILEEYLSDYHCLIVIHDEGILNYSEIIF